MSEIIYIGADIEFMAKDNKDYVYPNLIKPNSKNKALRSFGCDEFGHCLEVRPNYSTDRVEFLTNIMKCMEYLSAENVSCLTENAHILPAKKYIELVRAQGHKGVPECSNIYGQDILEDCPLDLEARKNKDRLIFCGTHIHISATKKAYFLTEENGKQVQKEEEIPIELPIKSLVYLFDNLIFPCFTKDTNFNIGRYRAPGFYEYKAHGGFEYRSLGSSVFTPARMSLLFEAIKYIVKNRDELLYLSLMNPPSKIRTKLPKPLRNFLFTLESSTSECKGSVLPIWTVWNYYADHLKD